MARFCATLAFSCSCSCASCSCSFSSSPCCCCCCCYSSSPPPPPASFFCCTERFLQRQATSVAVVLNEVKPTFFWTSSASLPINSTTERNVWQSLSIHPADVTEITEMQPISELYHLEYSLWLILCPYFVCNLFW